LVHTVVDKLVGTPQLKKDFISELLDREGEPRVYKNQVEGKGVTEVTNVMVNVFSERNVLSVAVEVLRGANLGGFADQLGKSFCPLGWCGFTSIFLCDCTGRIMGCNLVQKFSRELIQEVTFMDALFKALLNKGVITPERDGNIKALPTRRKKLSALLCDDLQDEDKKNIFLSVLKEQHPDLVISGGEGGP
uniref:CARD domain-containing protein n=1 Tax=Oryzias latipes TaxID=8090 RepID=A0A3P9I740_ORYLA